MLAVLGINFNTNSKINSNKQSFKGKEEVVEEGLSYLERMGMKFGNATRPMVDTIQITEQAKKQQKTIENRGINASARIQDIDEQISEIMQDRARKRAEYNAKYKNVPITEIPFGPIESTSWNELDIENIKLRHLEAEKVRLEKKIKEY